MTIRRMFRRRTRGAVSVVSSPPSVAVSSDHEHRWCHIPDPSGLYVGEECRDCGINRSHYEREQQKVREVGEPHRLSLPMIDRPPRRIIPTECLGCRLSVVACAATRDIERRKCCDICKHEPH